MRIKAPAKLNLFLNITGRREDGYHLLESLFVPLKLADNIILEPAGGIEVNAPGVSLLNNTALRAAELMRDFYKIKAGARITIEKKIPMGAGLGGSATDAAAVIVALCSFWRIYASPSDLLGLALQIGADVPYFLNPIPAYVSGIGEVIKPARMNFDMHVLVIYPGFELLARDVYNTYRHSEECSDVRIHNSKNDLEKAAISLKPEIGRLLEEIGAQEDCRAARMSGSGSACFGVFETKAAALKAEGVLSGRYFTYYEHLNFIKPVMPDLIRHPL